MEPILFRYRGRDLKGEDIAWVREVIAAHYARGRSFIAQVLCEHWAWRQPNGAYKGFAARDLLLRLEEAGHVTLPPRKAVKNNRAAPRFDHLPLYAEGLSGWVGDHPPPRIVEASGPERYLWDGEAAANISVETPGLAPGQAIVSFTTFARPLQVSIDPTPCRLLMVE